MYSVPSSSQPLPSLSHRLSGQLTDVIARPLFHQKAAGLKGHHQCLWKASVILILKRARKAWRTSYYSAITCVFMKFTTWFLLEAISCYTKDTMLTGNQKNGLSRDKLCLTNLTTFYTEMTDWLCGGEGNACFVVVVDLGFSKAFNTVSHRHGISIHGDIQNRVPRSLN